MANQVRVARRNGKIKIEIEIQLSEQALMMECEQEILGALNQAGAQATGEYLKGFDTDGSAIQLEGIRWTSKGPVDKTYQTPYGKQVVSRHVYQTSQGGATYCPLDEQARILNTSTPRFARMCAFKYGAMKSTLLQKDLSQNHGIEVSRCYLQDMAQEVAAVVESQGTRWRYADPVENQHVDRIALGIDGTCVLFCEEGYRQAMVGTISLYDIMGERIHTVYVAAEPEYGKESFYRKMEQEILEYQRRYPWAKWVAVADGARDHWQWLAARTQEQILDFYHAAGYLEKASAAMEPKRAKRSQWFEQSRHRLLEKEGGAPRLLKEMRRQASGSIRGKAARKDLESAVSYFENNLSRMNYVKYQRQGLPVGSGVTEAAAKTVVKERMSGSGMKWKRSGAATVLNLRAMILTEDRWEQFWKKISQHGL